MASRFDEALGSVGLGQIDRDRASADLARERLEPLDPPPLTITLAPRAASARAVASPMPPLAPVSSTLRPPRFTRKGRSWL